MRESERNILPLSLLFFFLLLFFSSRSCVNAQWSNERQRTEKKEKGDKLPSFSSNTQSQLIQDRKNNYLGTVGCLYDKNYVIQV